MSRYGTAQSKLSGAIDGLSPLAVSPNKACFLLTCGKTKLYAEIEAGELESYLDGRSRRITMESIRHYIKKRLAASGRSMAPMPRKLGRPRKDLDAQLNSQIIREHKPSGLTSSLVDNCAKMARLRPDERGG